MQQLFSSPGTGIYLVTDKAPATAAGEQSVKVPPLHSRRQGVSSHTGAVMKAASSHLNIQMATGGQALRSAKRSGRNRQNVCPYKTLVVNYRFIVYIKNILKYVSAK